MLLLSENKDYRYYAVEVPKESDNIRLSKGWFDMLLFDGGHLFLPSSSSKTEILGVIGNGEEISEEVLNELGYNGMTVDGKIFTHPSEALEYNLKEKGILIENPIPNPTFSIVKYTDTFEFKQWLQYESKLVKSVIIKVKK